MGDDSFQGQSATIVTNGVICLPPGARPRGVLPASDACLSGELISIAGGLGLPLGATFADPRGVPFCEEPKKSGEEEATV